MKMELDGNINNIENNRELSEERLENILILLNLLRKNKCLFQAFLIVQDFFFIRKTILKKKHNDKSFGS